MLRWFLLLFCALFWISPSWSHERSHMRKNPCFVGRAAELQQLREMLHQEKRVALVGTAGIGKTELARQYAYERFEDYDCIFWFDAKGDMILSLKELAARLNVPAGKIPLSRSIASIKRRLDVIGERYLLIFDSMPDDPLQLSYIPSPGQHSNCHVLITSRCGKFRTEERSSIELGRLQRSDSVLLLKRIAKKIPRIATQAERLAEVLEDFPLALKQSSAFLLQSGVPISDYIEQLRSNQATNLHEEPYEHTIGAVGLLSIEKIQKTDPFARTVLGLSSLMNGASIPIKLLEKMVHSKDELDKTLAALSAYSLIALEGDNIAMHRFFQRMVQKNLSDEERRQYLRDSLHFFNYHFNYSREQVFESRELEELFPHLNALLSIPFTQIQEPALAARLLAKIGEYELWEQYHYQRALEHLSLALKIEDALFQKAQAELTNMSGHTQIGLMQRRSGTLHFAIGRALAHLGQRVQAKEHFNKSLQIFKELKANEKTDKVGCYIASSIHGLARIAYEESDYKLSQKLFQQALAINKKFYNTEERFFISRDIHWLGRLCHKQGDFTQAIDLFKRSIEINQKVFGMEVPPYAGGGYCEMGRVFLQLNRFEEAESLFHQAIRAEEEHNNNLATPICARAHYYLGKLYLSLGQFELAQKHVHEALLTQMILYGSEEHPKVSATLRLLGQLFLAKGDHQTARSYFEKVYHIALKLQGSGPPTAERGKILLWLGKAAVLRNDFEQARLFFEQALTIHKQVYNSGSLHTASTIQYLIGQIQYELAHYDEAKYYFQKAWKSSNAVFATENHLQVANAYRGLAAVAVEKSEFAKAERYYSKALEIYRRIYKTEVHPDISHVLLEHAIVCCKLGEYDEGSEYCDQARAINCKLYNDHTNVFLANILIWRGRIAYREGNFAYAKETLLEAKRIVDVVFKDKKAVLRGLLNHFLSDVLWSLGELDEAYCSVNEALKEFNQIYSKSDHAYLVNTYTTLAKCCLSFKKYDEARSYLDKSLQLANKLNPKSADHRKTGIFFWYGSLEYLLGNYKQAELYFRREYYVLTAVHKNLYHPYVGVAYMKLADCLIQQGNKQAALYYYNKGMEVHRKSGFVFQHQSIAEGAELLRAKLDVEGYCKANMK